MSVIPEFQNQGIGGILITQLLEWAKQNKKIEKITLKVHATNTNAIHLYKSLGFEQEARIKKEIKLEDGTYCDSYQMSIFL